MPRSVGRTPGSWPAIHKVSAAVLNGLTMPWSSGVVEGNVNRLKMIKRQMYGRATFPLLRKRVLLS
jgi:transposase